jgi:murein DD-endopeptidase MepM/ murein hydrolase activator NlpD
MQYGQNKKFAFIFFLLTTAIFTLNACTTNSSNKNLVLEGTVTEESGTLDPSFQIRQKKAEENFFSFLKPYENQIADDDDFIDDAPLSPLQNLSKSDKNTQGYGFTKLQLIWPTTGKYSSLFGSRKLGRVRRMHAGIDISAATGTPIHAAADGQVLFSGRKRGYGEAVILAHDSSHETLYAHMSKISVHNGQFVHRNQIIGFVGKTGHVTGANLHFETRINGVAYNPIFFLPSGASGKIKIGMKTPSYGEQIAYYGSNIERVAYVEVKKHPRSKHRKQKTL